EQVLRIGPGQARHRLDALENRAACVQLHLLLREVADLDAVADPDALSAHEPFEQGRLARAVRADERDVLAALERERRFAQQDTVADRDLQAVRLHDGASAPRRLEELEAEPARTTRQQRDLTRGRGPLLLEPADLGQLRLRLLRLALLVSEPLHEP